MRRDWLRMTAGVFLLAAAVFVGSTHGATEGKPGIPGFQPDPAWPKIPEGMKFGMMTGVAVDRQDHVWALHRPTTVKGGKPLPIVVEFDASGKYLQGWGGPGEGYDWPLDQDE